jgi:hypothetical protein
VHVTGVQTCALPICLKARNPRTNSYVLGRKGSAVFRKKFFFLISFAVEYQ